MILQDPATTNISQPGQDQQVLMEKLNLVILLMSVIFVLLCIILSVCFILWVFAVPGLWRFLRYFIISRLAYFFVQRKKPCRNNCSCRSVASETQFSKNSKSPTFLPPSASPNYVWTVEQDPIYEDILDLKNPSNATVTSGGAPVKNNNKPSSHEVRKKSSVQYGVITAKEVAKFVPSEIVIRRWHWTQNLKKPVKLSSHSSVQ